MATPIWPIEGVALDSTGDMVAGDMVAGSLTDSINDMRLHSLSRGLVYPTLAAGATVVSANTDWVLGALATVVPANTITTEFHVHDVSIESCDRDAVFEIVLYYGGGDTEFSRKRFAISGGFFGNVQIPMTCLKVPANSRVRAALASSNGTAQIATITMSITYAEEG
jgi:hypothetical protein